MPYDAVTEQAKADGNPRMREPDGKDTVECARCERVMPIDLVFIDRYDDSKAFCARCTNEAEEECGTVDVARYVRDLDADYHLMRIRLAEARRLLKWIVALDPKPDAYAETLGRIQGAAKLLVERYERTFNGC